MAVNKIETVQALVLNTQPAFEAVLCDKSIAFQREAEFAMQAMQANDYLIDCATKNPQSVIDAVTNIAAIGISLNPAKKHAYLVPRKGKICLDISYMGLMDLAIQSGSIRWAQAVLVHATDRFSIIGVDKPPVHERDPFAKDRGDVIGVYVVAKTADGDYLTETMTRDEIDGIMNRSESVKAGKTTPWKTDYGEMAKKTVVKRAQKYWPKTDRLEKAVHYMDTDGGEGITLNPDVLQLTPDQMDDVLARIAEFTDADALATYYPELVKWLRTSASMSQYEHIKQAVADKGADLKAAQGAPA
ncbi:recombinase RecT [Castellaniella denitrificans]|uniref:Recombinase RecT n=1 Tax=Castellaniella denitrificans TaxID=56119 RepID=A0ABT4M609_9BURK|nr:recombinase RecT [Castellaniella denitrificans]MCZ4330745.1 recombinase RecT [Castellaniella denitrificans]